jgi:hypothetical protein
MAPNDIVIAQLLAENQQLRQTVKFLNAKVDAWQERTPALESSDTRGREVEEGYRLPVDTSQKRR